MFSPDLWDRRLSRPARGQAHWQWGGQWRFAFTAEVCKHGLGVLHNQDILRTLEKLMSTWDGVWRTTAEQFSGHRDRSVLWPEIYR